MWVKCSSSIYKTNCTGESSVAPSFPFNCLNYGGGVGLITFNILNIQYSQYSIFFIIVEGWVWSPSILNQLSSVVNTVTMSLDDSHYLYIFCVYSFISLKDSVCSIALVYCVCIYQSQKCWITYQVDLQVLEDQYIWWAYKPIDDHRGILFTTNIFPPFLALAHAGSRGFLFSDNIHITDILYDKYCSYWKWRH